MDPKDSNLAGDQTQIPDDLPDLFGAGDDAGDDTSPDPPAPDPPAPDPPAPDGDDAGKGDDGEGEKPEDKMTAPGEKKTPAPEPKKDDDALPPQVQRALDDIARRQNELDSQQQSFKQNMAELQQLRQLQDQLKTDPLAAIRSAGGDAAAAIDAMLGGGEQDDELAKNPTVKKLMQKISELEQGNKSLAQQRKEEQIAKDQQAIYEAYQTAAKSAEKDHPIVSVFADQHGPATMYSLARTYAAKGKVPEDSVLLKEANEILRERARDVVTRVAKIPEMAEYMKQLVGAEKDLSGDATDASDRPRKKRKTLTNKHGQGPTSSDEPVDVSKLTKDQIVEYALRKSGGLWKT